MFHVPNSKRVRMGRLATTEADGNNGAFIIQIDGKLYSIIASDGMGWEHVSVNHVETPSWEAMCKIKDIFWDPQDCVVQYHPPKSEYVNIAKNVLHLWRPTNQTIIRPPMFLV